MKRFFMFFAPIFLFFSSAFGAFAQDRGFSLVVTDNLGQQATAGKQYALFIAVDAYRYWPALKKPVADAREIRDILKKDYYIDEVIELHNQNATKQNIIKTFTDLQGKLGIHDSLFIYYAGHGHLDAGSNTGFWIPVDGGTDPNAQENWLPNSQIRGYISRFKSIHVFMVSDACFSGDILNTNRSMPPQIDNAFYRKAYALTSRQVLTSGSSETVPDQSEFSEALKMCLRKNTAALIDPFGIYSDVRLSVRSTTPLYGTLSAANHQEGATFLFFRRQGTAAPATVVTPQPAPAPVTPPVPAVVTPQPAPAPAGDIDAAIKRAAEGLMRGIPNGVKVAVMAISASDQNMAEFVCEELQYLLINSGRYLVVDDRRTLDMLKAEQNIRSAGELNDNARGIGRMLGVSVVITGSISGSGSTRRLQLQAADVQTSRIISSAREPF